MRKLYTLLILLILQFANPLGAVPGDTLRGLSDQAFASLLTCGPGDEFYESFGHTAVRICDSTNHIDIVFNYGCFDFTVRHFYLKFAKGQLDYCVVAQPFGEFMFEYQYFKRAVWEQRLRLKKNELEQLFSDLLVNAQPENMYYKYDFFRDNCATRVRDRIEQALDGRQLARSLYPVEDHTYRDLIYKHTEGSLLWWRLGVDLLLGCHCDMRMTTGQYTFIPLDLMTQYDTCKIRYADAIKKASASETLANPSVQLLTDQRKTPDTSISPTLCFWVLFALIVSLTVVSRYKGWRLYWLDGVLYCIAGAVSLLLLFLWFGSDHWCCKNNLNLLWANPLFLWLLFRLRHRDLVVTLIIGCILLVFLAGWPLWPQHFNIAVLPISLTLFVRLIDKILVYRKHNNS